MNAPHHMDWDDLRVLLALSRHGSVRAAARAMNVSHTTVSRRMVNLETGLGARILERDSSGTLVPTADGSELLRAAEEAERRLDEAQRRIRGRDARLSGVLRISVFRTASSFFLPHLLAFHDDYPEIELEIIETNETANLTRREADIALRVAHSSPPQGLIGRKFGGTAYGLYVARAHRQQVEENPHDAVEVLCFADQPSTLNDETWLKEQFPNTFATVRTTSIAIMSAIAEAGPRLLRLPCLLGDIQPDLFRLRLDPTDWGYDLWLLTHPDLRRTARVAAFMSFAGDRLVADRDLIEGRRPAP